MYVGYFTIDVQPGKTERCLEACLENVKTTVRSEPDCLRFEVLRDSNDQNRVCFVEVYTNEKALEAHFETPHFNKFWETVEDLIEGEAGRKVGRADLEFIYTSDPSLGSRLAL